MKLMVLDGNSIVNRAYYGIRPLTTRDGLYTNAVYGFVTTLQRLVEDLFMSSTLEDEGIFFEEDRVDFAQLIAEIAEENAAEAARRKITWNCRFEAVQGCVWIDPLRMRQAVQNLIDNAFTYTKEGGRITLRLWTQDGSVLLSVSDTGKGITPEDLPYVFDRYFSANRSDNPKSSGLGLSIARQIVQHARGEIAVSSEVGKGTTFTVRLSRLQE